MPEDLSLTIKARLLEAVESAHGEIGELRARIHNGDAYLMSAISVTVDESFDEITSPDTQHLNRREWLELSNACDELLFTQRVKQIALEAVHGEALSPPLQILPALPPRNQRLSPFNRREKIVAVVAEYLPHLTNELFPLMVDTYVYSLSAQSNRKTTVIGVHEQWLTDGLEAMRCIAYIPDDDEVIETPLDPPLQFDAVFYLCLSPECHQTLSEQFNRACIVEINPYRQASLADDKYACYCRWKEKGIATPEAVSIPQSDRKNVMASLEDAFKRLFSADNAESVTLVLQPNQGTEGRGVSALTGPPEWEAFLSVNPVLLEESRRILHDDDLLLRKGIGNILWCDGATETDVYFDIRLNTIDGEIESGFLTIAGVNQVVSSPAKGGRVIEWKRWEEMPLRVFGESRPLNLGDREWQAIVGAAESAAEAIPGCRIAGVDLRLEWRGETNELIPWVLDINPRPAGFAHSRYIGSLEPGVTQRLWSDLSWNVSPEPPEKD